MLKTNPDKITMVQLDCVLMPNGEVICLGKSIGWFKTLKDHLTIKEEKGT